MKPKRRYPVGAEIVPGGVHFRVWAPNHTKVSVILEDKKNTSFPLKNESDGYFSALIPTQAGALYRYALGENKELYSDPASRFQPKGPMGPSEVVDPAFPWTDRSWKGISPEKEIIYEMHIGTFTQEGTFKAAMQQLPELKELGITIIEVMPLNDFTGDFGWGYDGVCFFAPTRLYGTPTDVKAFIDRAHALGIAVILDVVYNHFGPEGNYLMTFSKDYVSPTHNEWGASINFDCPQVREFFLTNARYWIEEFHFDGLRFDATSCIISTTPVHILAELTHTVRSAAGKRRTFIVGENEPQNVQLLQTYEEGGYGFDSLWNDDYHHNAYVRLTGVREAYCKDYFGSPQEFISTLKYGFLYQGQFYNWQKKRRGTPELNLPPSRLVTFLENHDQISNSGSGRRLHQVSDPGNFRALTALLLLGPNIPMLFQGQEFYSSRPFNYFSIHHDTELNRQVNEGRKVLLAQFPRLASDQSKQMIPDASDEATFLKYKLDFTEREKNAPQYLMHKDLIALRKSDLVFKSPSKYRIDGAVIGPESFIIRFFHEQNYDRLMIINLGTDFTYSPAPEPLIVAGQERGWQMLWSSENPKYGGKGIPAFNIDKMNVPGHCALVLKAVKRKKHHETDYREDYEPEYNHSF